MKRAISAFAAVLILATAAQAQDQGKIDQAIKRGIGYLKGAGSPGHEHSKATHCDELILYTFIIAEVSPGDAKFKQMLERVLTDPPYQTYKVALQAMALEELDRAKYQWRIAQCAQHLVDNQCTNGQWTYGTPTEMPKDMTSTDAKGDVASTPVPPRTGVRDFSSGARKEKPKLTKKIAVKRQRDGGASGDNSNSQYAALGLRACYDSGIMIPEETIQLAIKWWMESAKDEGKAGKNDVVSGEGGGRTAGWGYRGAGDGEAYGSMTAGAVGALTIYDYMLKKNWKSNPFTKAGLTWLGAHYSVKDNPGRGGDWYRYYLYGLERAGILYGTEKIGGNDWYADGAKALLAQQDANGAWDKEWDTCFAILFLKKATKPLVATEGASRK